jgi:hypothetical protein
MGAVDFTHPARADWREDFLGPKFVSGVHSCKLSADSGQFHHVLTTFPGS